MDPPNKPSKSHTFPYLIRQPYNPNQDMAVFMNNMEFI